ncbi:MAG: hypothetical protein N2504_05175 [candidate division WOR-3 bacterium]|nr:hypothetical protein [candidate division WOR-3 bacterium]MCX7947962.1 hypothetical protein [candidate division WOR-3 bacterium]MDW8150906.1 hypothetical protein [candidate division WOR-3 bacterium]
MFLNYVLISDFPFRPNIKIDDKVGADEQAEISITITKFKSLSSWIGSGGNWYDVSIDTTNNWNIDKNNVFGNDDCCDPVAKEYNGIIHLVWLNWNSIEYTRTDDFGNSFIPNKVIAQGFLDHPWMAVKKDTIAIIFTSYNVSNIITVACSFDGGNTWTLVNITNGAVPIITTDRQKFWAIFWDYDPSGIGIVVSSSTNCLNWSTPQKVAVMDAVIGPNPYPQGIHADAFAGRVLNAYMHTRTGSRNDWRVYISRYNLIEWDSFMVSPNSDNSIYYMPAITFDPYGNAHLFYFYRITNKKWALYHSYSSDFGNNWSNPIRVSDTTFEFVDENECGGVDNVDYYCWPGHYIEAYADSQNVYVAWSDNRTGYFHVYSTYAKISQIVKTYESKEISKLFLNNKKIIYLADGTENISVKIYKIDGSLIFQKNTRTTKGHNIIYELKKPEVLIVKINEKTYKIGGY